MAPPVDPRGAGAGPAPWASRAHVRGEHDPPCGPSGSTRELHRIHTVGEPEPPAGPTGCTLCCKWIHRVLHVVPLGSNSGPTGKTNRTHVQAGLDPLGWRSRAPCTPCRCRRVRMQGLVAVYARSTKGAGCIHFIQQPVQLRGRCGTPIPRAEERWIGTPSRLRRSIYGQGRAHAHPHVPCASA